MKLPAIVKHTTIICNNDGLKQFVSTEDINEHINTLAGITVDFVMAIPISQFAYNWPPVNIILDCCQGKSKLMTLYNALFDELSENGYSVSVLMTMKVLQHDPKKYTVLSLPLSSRIGALH
jgi:hypothetical protein